MRRPAWIGELVRLPDTTHLLISQQERWTGVGMALPMMLNQYVVFAATVLIAVGIAFTDMGPSLRWDFVGLENFRRLLADPAIGAIAVNTVLFVVLGLAFDLVWGFVVALFSIRYVRPRVAGTAFRMIWLLPRVTPGVVKALLWTWAFSASERGLLNALLGWLWGMEPVAWLSDYPLTVNILLAGVVGSSFAMIVLTSSISAIDPAYFHLAEIDGASEWSVVKDVVLPFLRWPFTFLLVWQGLSLLTTYETILLLTNGGPMRRSTTWSLYAFQTAFQTHDFGYGSAISLLLLPISVVVMVAVWRSSGLRSGGARG